MTRERLSDSNESFPAGVSCSWKRGINAACLAGSVVPAGEIFSGTSIAYLENGLSGLVFQLVFGSAQRQNCRTKCNEGSRVWLLSCFSVVTGLIGDCTGERGFRGSLGLPHPGRGIVSQILVR